MKIKFFAILTVFLSLSVSAYSNDKTQANITGHIIDVSTGQHLPFTTVLVKGTTIAAAADARGHYNINNIPEGEVTIVANMTGYKSVEKMITSQRNKTTEVNFDLDIEPISVDQIVVTANRNETKRRESVSLVNVATSKLFENTASASPAEVLNFQSGTRVEWNCTNCGVPSLRINGLDGQYSQVLIDSRPLLSALASVYGLEQLPAGMIEQVEVIRGGGSALFGSSAVGGVVNIITKEPLRNSFSLSSNLGIMEGGATDLNTNLNGSLVTDDFRTGIYLFGSIRDRKEYDRNGDGFSEIPKIANETIGFRGYHKTGDYSRLTMEYHHINEERRGGNNLDRPAHEADLAEQLHHKIDGGGMKYEFMSKDYKHRTNFYTSAQNIDRNSYFGTQQNPDAYGKTNDITFVVGGQWNYSFDRLWFLPSVLTVGAEYNYDNLHDKMLGYDRDIKQIIRSSGGYVQNEWKSEKISALIGARIDKHNLIKNVIFSPRANVRYQPIEILTFRLGYSSGYRAPQAYDEDLHVGAVGGEVMLIQLDPDLEPEYSHSLSASVDFLKTFGQVQLNVLIDGFYTDLQDVFTLQEDGQDSYGNLIMVRRNEDGARVLGLSTEVRLAVGQKYNMQAGFTLQQSRYKKPFSWSDNANLVPQRKMFRSPDNYGYLTLTYNPVKQLGISFNGTYTGPMLLQHNQGYIAENLERLSDSFFDLGIRVAYDFSLGGKLKMQVNAGVKNFLDSFQKDLDKGYEKDAKYIYGPAFPRTYHFGVKFYI